MKTIYLSGDVGYEITADKIRAKLGEAKTEKLQVIVNSHGGYVFEAFEIYNIFKSYKGRIEFVIAGIAASAMSYILMAGDKISAFKNSTFMAHKAWSLGIGDSDELEREANLLKSIDNVMAEAYSAKLGKSKEETLAEMKKEIWLVGWEALSNAGLIEDVIDSFDELDAEVTEEEEMQIKELEGEQASAENTKLKILRLQSRMRKDEERNKLSADRAAAFLQKFVLPEASGNIINKEEGGMSLQELLQKNPEAEAEYQNALAAAKAEGAKEVSADVSAERKRIAKIIRIADAGVSPAVVAAIDNNTEPSDFAISQKEEELARQEASSTQPTPFGALLSRQTPQEQTPNAQAQDKSEAEEFEAKLRAALKKQKEA